MTTDEQGATPRPGSTVDLSRRMDRMEEKYDDLAREVASLTGTVARVELNQAHQAELSKQSFAALDRGLDVVGGKLDAFITRVNGLISGEIRLPQNDALMADWREWRNGVENKLELSEAKLGEQAVLNGQVRLSANLLKILVGGNVVAIIGVIAALMKS